VNVSAFPLQRRRNVVNDVVCGLNRHRGEDANRFWREKATVLLQDLVEDGVALEEAKEQVRSLLYTALNEMHQASAIITEG
jgi:hypothetical protein